MRIASPSGDRYRFLDDPAPVIEGLRESGSRVDLFTFSQRLPEPAPRFAYRFEWDNYAAIPVSTYDHWWTNQLNNKTRNVVRLAEKKGVVLRECSLDGALAAGIREIYNESPIRQGRRFIHFGKDLATVYREEATLLDSSVFVGAFFEDTLIGFIKLVMDETCTQAGLMNIISMLKHRDKAPQNALVAHAVRFCANRGIRYLVYSRFDYGRDRQDGIRRFKEHNGFQRVDTPRYYVPLSPAGSLALRMGLHRDLRGWIPQSVAGRLRDLRSAWLSSRYRSADV